MASGLWLLLVDATVLVVSLLSSAALAVFGVLEFETEKVDSAALDSLRAFWHGSALSAGLPSGDSDRPKGLAPLSGTPWGALGCAGVRVASAAVQHEHPTAEIGFRDSRFRQLFDGFGRPALDTH